MILRCPDHRFAGAVGERSNSYAAVVNGCTDPTLCTSGATSSSYSSIATDWRDRAAAEPQPDPQSFAGKPAGIGDEGKNAGLAATNGTA
jgi:hypothetical protein